MSMTDQLQGTLEQWIETALCREVGGHRISARQTFRFRRDALLSRLQFLLPPVTREFHVFCIGLPRSGTHSLAFLFSPEYPARHEPLTWETITYILDWLEGRCSTSKIGSFLTFRDKCLRLTLEASHYLHHVVDLLVPLFPEAKFILTVREPISWLASEFCQNLVKESSHNKLFWTALETYRYGRYNHEYHYDTLRQTPFVYPIASYLAYWKQHISRVLEAVPKERVLIVDTFEINDSIDTIVSFVGADRSKLNLTHTQSGQRHSPVDLYSLVDKEWVKQLIQEDYGAFIRSQTPFLLKHMPYLT